MSLKKMLTFRENNKPKRPRHFRILQTSTKPSMVENTETVHSKTSSSTVDVEKFVKCIKTRVFVDKRLHQYYRNETQKPNKIYFPDSLFDFCVDEKDNLSFWYLFVTRIQGNPISLDSCTQFQLYATCIRFWARQITVGRQYVHLQVSFFSPHVS